MRSPFDFGFQFRDFYNSKITNNQDISQKKPLNTNQLENSLLGRAENSSGDIFAISQIDNKETSVNGISNSLYVLLYSCLIHLLSFLNMPVPVNSVPTSPPSPQKPCASNTGVKPGTKLKIYDGNLNIKTPGTVLENLEINGTVTINAPNVTLKNCIIRGSASGSPDVALVAPHSTGTVIENCEIVPRNPGSAQVGVQGYGFTMTNTNIHGCVDSVQIFKDGNVTIHNSWLHDNAHLLHDPSHNGGPSHDDGIQISGGSNILIKNTVIEGGQNASVMISQNTDKVGSVVFDGVWFGSANAGINIYDTRNKGAMKEILVKNSFFNPSGKYAIIAQKASMPISTNNIYEGTATAIKITNGG